MFSPAVKAEQTRLGSRAQFEGRAFKSEITDDLRQFLAVIDTFFLATASADGRPYVQHRGGPPGLLKPIGAHMLAFADFGGNRQYITLGHLKENDRAHIFILHFATRQRVKLWGRARVVEGDLELMERLVDPNYKARPERAILFTLEAWDANCPQHIVPRYSEAEIAPAIDKLAQRIKELEEEVARLKGNA
jgi:predicted pyridoxine 5'-phosphate oxidase superfamily flavin-nucleotide-binding protein